MKNKAEELLAVLEKLPPRCKRVFILVYYHQYLFNEVAEQMKMSTPEVRLLYLRTRDHLVSKWNDFK